MVNNNSFLNIVFIYIKQPQKAQRDKEVFNLKGMPMALTFYHSPNVAKLYNCAIQSAARKLFKAQNRCLVPRHDSESE